MISICIQNFRRLQSRACLGEGDRSLSFPLFVRLLLVLGPALISAFQLLRVFSFFFTLLMVSAKIVAKLQARQDEAVQLAELHSRTAATLSRKVDNGSNNNKDRRLNWRPIPASPTMEPTTEHVSVIIV